ncbi:hypothetical protein NADFUDRAFT_43103 [Nadsonia fulvescens var. elongata DSM 6958]|uniref:Uncharacterized protein n=1 Tax=Nadsonia fulvescens var. elongata DSM 6958 TaxID=857566 RepID=A0A1E3PIY0_9ASCO|nr:hypothetical protein NADFUDRAFT_43103 [Nadsonia fulvescens var. elongata DSM 6958]
MSYNVEILPNFNYLDNSLAYEDSTSNTRTDSGPLVNLKCTADNTTQDHINYQLMEDYNQSIPRAPSFCKITLLTTHEYRYLLLFTERMSYVAPFSAFSGSENPLFHLILSTTLAPLASNQIYLPFVINNPQGNVEHPISASLFYNQLFDNDKYSYDEISLVPGSVEEIPSSLSGASSELNPYRVADGDLADTDPYADDSGDPLLAVGRLFLLSVVLAVSSHYLFTITHVPLDERAYSRYLSQCLRDIGLIIASNVIKSDPNSSKTH